MNLSLPTIERLVLLGGGKLLLSLAEWCNSESFPVSVVTSPRHAQEKIDECYTLSERLEVLSVPYLVTESLDTKESKTFLGNLSYAFCLSLGAAWIFKKHIINDLFQSKLFNLHGTRLPQNRGGGGFSWQILMGNRLGFCQLHLIDYGIDTGDLVKTKEFLFPPECRIPLDYEKVYYEENLTFVLDFINEIRQVEINLQTTKQSEYFSSYWPRLDTTKNAWIDWSDEVTSLERFVCAFDDPYAGSKTFLNGDIVFLKSVMCDFGDQNFHKFQSGIIYRKGPSWLSVCVNGGTLIVRQVLNGAGEDIFSSIQVGDRFVTPQEYIDSRYERIIYTPSGQK